jgi:AmmeMemoRadiSam system protein A
MTLNPEEKAFLRDLAERSVRAAVQGAAAPDPRKLAAAIDLPLEPRLSQKRGVFVTLTAGGALRGCIGYIEGHKPLIDAVVDNGRGAAVGDPRFAPVTVKELPGLEMEISALTPLKQVEGPEEIQIGRHGILLSARGRRAVFLPQVAVEQGWDLETTLGHLALKAGLAPNAWQEGAVLQVFEAEIF